MPSGFSLTNEYGENVANEEEADEICLRFVKFHRLHVYLYIDSTVLFFFFASLVFGDGMCQF
jgi:hypothetical protein